MKVLNMMHQTTMENIFLATAFLCTIGLVANPKDDNRIQSPALRQNNGASFGTDQRGKTSTAKQHALGWGTVAVVGLYTQSLSGVIGAGALAAIVERGDLVIQFLDDQFKKVVAVDCSDIKT